MRPTHAVCALVMALTLAAAPASVRASAPADPCARRLSTACIADYSLQLIESGEARAAVDYLKTHRARFESEPELVYLLARGYLALDNAVWARRTLLGRLTAAPEDCEARAWLAWVMISDADLPGAREILGRDGCPANDTEHARWALLEAVIEREAGDGEAAKAALARAGEAGVLYAEDVAMLAHMRRSLWPDRAAPPVQIRAQLKAGWTSNPLFGSPLDPTASVDDLASTMGELKLWTRVGGPFVGMVQPYAEIDVDALGFGADAAGDLSYLSLAFQPGVAFAPGGVVIRASYRFDALLLAGGDGYDREGPLWFYQGHRADLRLEHSSSLSVFGGFGHREFRQLGRTRWEVDLGVGGGGPLGSRLMLLGGLSGRMYRATNEAYHLWGGTALGSLQVRLGAGWSARLVASLALDHYPDSAALYSQQDARQDWMVKGRVSVWTPPLPLASQLGVSYEPSHRESAVDEYTFTDHRVLLQLRMVLNRDPYQPETAQPAGHVALDYGISGSGADFGERLQELLRQDEDAQRGSSCLAR